MGWNPNVVQSLLGQFGGALATMAQALPGNMNPSAAQNALAMNQGMVDQAFANEQKRREEEARKKAKKQKLLTTLGGSALAIPTGGLSGMLDATMENAAFAGSMFFPGHTSLGEAFSQGAMKGASTIPGSLLSSLGGTEYSGVAAGVGAGLDMMPDNAGRMWKRDPVTGQWQLVQGGL